MKASDELAAYKKFVQEKLSVLVPIFAKASIGEFTTDLKIPEKEDEFTEFYVGIQIMIDVIREKITDYEALNAELEKKVQDRIAELVQSASLLDAALDATADGILVVDSKGKITKFNKQFIKLWKIPKSIINTKDDNKALEYVMSQLKDPKLFRSKVQELYDHPEAESFDILEFKDGRIFERVSKPQRAGGETRGRVWSFRDTTARYRAMEELKLRAVELEKMNKFMVGREVRMSELKQEVKDLKTQRLK